MKTDEFALGIERFDDLADVVGEVAQVRQRRFLHHVGLFAQEYAYHVAQGVNRPADEG